MNVLSPCWEDIASSLVSDIKKDKGPNNLVAIVKIKYGTLSISGSNVNHIVVVDGEAVSRWCCNISQKILLLKMETSIKYLFKEKIESIIWRVDSRLKTPEILCDFVREYLRNFNSILNKERYEYVFNFRKVYHIS